MTPNTVRFTTLTTTLHHIQLHHIQGKNNNAVSLISILAPKPSANRAQPSSGMVVDYSKWDNLVVSDSNDSDIEDNTAEHDLPTTVVSNYDTRSKSQTTTKDNDADTITITDTPNNASKHPAACNRHQDAPKNAHLLKPATPNDPTRFPNREPLRLGPTFPNEEEYEIETILDHRDIRGRREYLVHWLGYPNSDDSWVKEKDLHTANLLEEYLAAIEKEKHDNEASPGDQAKGRRGIRATLPATPPVGQRSNSNPD